MHTTINNIMRYPACAEDKESMQDFEVSLKKAFDNIIFLMIYLTDVSKIKKIRIYIKISIKWIQKNLFRWIQCYDINFFQNGFYFLKI